MFGLEDLKQTQYFQDVAAEAEQQGELKGKLKSVPGLLKLGLTIEQIDKYDRIIKRIIHKM